MHAVRGFSSALDADVHSSLEGKTEQIREHRCLFAQILVRRIGKRRVVTRGRVQAVARTPKSSIRRSPSELPELFWLRHWEHLEQRVIDLAEYRNVSADSNSQCQHDCCGERPVVDELPHTVAKVRPQLIKEPPAESFAPFLFVPFDRAKLQACLPHRVFL